MSLMKYKIKCVILGSPEDIKTRLLRAICNSYFQRCYKNIIGVDIGITQLIVNKIPIILSFWDCLCENRINYFRSGFYKGSDVVIICYDSNTMDNVEIYFNEYCKINGEKLPILYIYVKQNEYDSKNLLEAEKNGIELQNLDEALNWLAQTIINPKQVKRVGYLEIMAEILPEVMPDISFEVSHPEILAPILENMGFEVLDQQVVNILKDKALFSVNLFDASVNIYPLLCDVCKRNCKREKNICIILNTTGWTTFSDLSQKDLLILSKIYALANLPYESLPNSIKNQITNILFCKKFRKK